MYLKQLVSNFKIFKFWLADDLALAFQCISFEEGEIILTSDLKIIDGFLENWGLQLSISKTEVSCFHLKNNETNRTLNVSYKQNFLKHNHVPRYLGVDLDRTLSYKPHLERTSKKIRSRINIIQRMAGTI